MFHKNNGFAQLLTFVFIWKRQEYNVFKSKVIPYLSTDLYNYRDTFIKSVILWFPVIESSRKGSSDHDDALMCSKEPILGVK